MSAHVGKWLRASLFVCAVWSAVLVMSSVVLPVEDDWIDAAMTLPGTGTNDLYAQAPGMGETRSRVEITIKDRQHGYETVGFTMPLHETTIVVRNQDNVTHGFASKLFKNIPVRVEGGVEVKGKAFISYHVDPGHTMTLRFETAPSNFDPATGTAESVRHALWCDIHPEVKGEVYVIETRGEIGGG